MGINYQESDWMTLQQAIKSNPYNPERGNLSAYIRYLRYTVDGYYNKTSKEVRDILKNCSVEVRVNDA
jgi:hypothetical protein